MNSSGHGTRAIEQIMAECLHHSQLAQGFSMCLLARAKKNISFLSSLCLCASALNRMLRVPRPMKMHVLPFAADLLPDARFLHAADVNLAAGVNRLRQAHVAQYGAAVA